MPIRFRCAYCNQLMGIATRKAGTVIRCPKCAGQVIVPNPQPAGSSPDEPQSGSGNKPVLFEGSDFDKIFDAPAPTAPPMPRPAPFVPAPSVQSNGSHEIEPIPSPLVEPGIFLSPGKLTVLSVIVVLLLGLAFFVGMLVGRDY